MQDRMSWRVGKKSKIFTQLLAAVHWQATTSEDRSPEKDDVRKENEHLCAEIDSLAREHKKLKQIIEHLERDYENSKGYDPLRRYEKLKGMIKRTIMHLKLNPNDAGTLQTSGLGVLTHRCKEVRDQIESARRREDKYTKMSRQELQQENVELLKQLRELRRRCAIIRDLIDDMQKSYVASKRVAVLQRYVKLKAMIKLVIHDELV